MQNNGNTIKADNLPAAYPLTGVQLGVYLDSIRRTESCLYNITACVTLPEGTDKARYIDAVKTVAAKHKVLFVTIGTPNGVPSMICHEGTVKVSESSAESRKAFVDSFRRPFNLENGPLYRFEYVTTPGGELFFFDVHHLIFDGTSLKVFVEEIASVYNGGSCADEKLTIFEYSENEHNIKDDESERKYREYFESKFGGMDCDSKPVPDIMGTEKPEKWGFITSDCENVISFDEIDGFLRESKINENALFLGAFGYALAKYNGADHSVFTTANHGRADKRLASTFGMFVKTLPLICKFDENETPEDYLRRVYDDYYITKKNESIPFNEIAESYGLSTGVSFIYQSDFFTDVALENGMCRVEPEIIDSSVSDIEVMLMKKASGFAMECFYNSADYSEAFIRGLVKMFIGTIKEMVRASALKEISLVDEESADKLEKLNRTEKEYDASKTVIDLFREQAAKTPDAPCIVYNGKTYTYREADAYSDKLAAYLHSCGLEKEKIAAVLVPRSEYMTLCSLAALKAGGAYLPMDTSYPPERLNLMIQDSGAIILITTPELNEVIDETFSGKRIMISEEKDIPEADCIPSPPKPDDLFCIIYTSGSTGIPKGVMYNHSNAAVTTEFVKKYYDMSGSSRIAAYASYGFDANIYDTYPAITSGAALHIISDEIRLDLLAVRDYFNENGITHSVMTTQVGRQFALIGGHKTLKHLSVAGEKLTAGEVPEGFNFYNLYGPTEGSVITSGFLIDGSYRDIPIGNAVDNLKLHIVDKCGRLLPAGAVGELWISGPHVTRGYLNRPEKTAEAFGENPFCTDKGYERIYRTGDIVRLAEDGNLQFIGRRDGQVKIRGFRVELKEIEEIILRFDGIKDATVAAFDDANGGKFLAAYIVSDEEISIDALNDFIHANKPPYMVPAVTMQIDKIPLNQNQKVNKKALPVPKRKADNIVMPENDIQQKILDIVADIIGHNEFGVDTDIFASGLTSIGTLKLNIQLGTEFGTSVKIDDIRQNNTVRKLEALLSSCAEQTEYEIMTDYPITQTQQGIFVECSSKPNTVTYNMPVLIRLGKNTDTAKLVSSVKAAINAHPYLKATLFADENGDIRARRNDSEAPQVDEKICETIPDAKELVIPFELLGGRLYRITVYKTENGNYLFMDFHHIISDGASEAILLNDIDRAYSGQEIRAEKYTGFEAALDEKAERESKRYEDAKTYYDSIFSGCESDCLPPKAPETGKTGAASVKRRSGIDPEKVYAFCKKNNFTPNAFFNAAFGFTISRFGQFDDAIYATIYNGRSDSRLASSVTMLVKTLPVLVHTEGSRAVSDLISETQKQLIGSMSNDIYSFAEISAAYGIRSDILFVYQGDNFEFSSLCGEPAEFISVLPDVAKAAISVNVYLKGNKFEIDAEYISEMYNEAFIESLVDIFELVIEGFTEKDKTAEISLLSEKADRLLDEINNTAVEFENIPVNRFIERHAAETPDKIAITAQDASITYDELNRLANRMAHVLVKYGVKKDSVVGLMFDRVTMLSVTELAIIKAGGAFLGLLPEYPDDRVDFCLIDAGSPVVVTTEEIKASRPSLFSEDKPYITLTTEELLANEDDENLDLDIPADSLAYCIYTSGSTGNPKGVMVEHHNLASFVSANPSSYSSVFHDKNVDKCIAVCSITFDVSVMDNIVMLMNGKTVIMASNREIHNPELFAELMEKHHTEYLMPTPSFLTNMIGYPSFRAALKNLKVVGAGGEAFSGLLYEELKAINENLIILNGYGPSETTISSSSKILKSSRKITIGGPNANTSYYVVDKFGNILPPYACGELIICGELVGRGYMNLPEKTKASFFTLRGKRAYHSGDIVRFNDDGEIEFFGRKDNQVKLRGFRVELDEIENCICSYAGISQSKVIVRNNGSEDFLAGFFTADHQVDMEKLVEHMKSKLTYYMVPDAMMQLEAMPLTPNGKIDKKALPEIKKESKKGKSGRKAPKKSLEEQLCDLFKSILSLDEYFADDNFFEMGGTSLSASKVTMQLMSKGIKVEYQDIFSYPTPEALAEYIESLNASKVSDMKPENTETKSDYDDVLKYNSLEYAADVVRESIGDVLLTGAVGFLGSHVLKELIDRKEGKIICLVRRGNEASPEIRLKNMLMYYFGSTFESEFKNTISVVEADITDDNIDSALGNLHFDTLINCAACVKHYASDDVIEKINVHGVENLINLAKKKNAGMIQISTTSVPGVHTNESWVRQVRMHENELFIIDDMDNKYCISKYNAEKKMFNAIRNGFRGKVIRVGNLMGRHSDGEFQINFNTNAFMNALRGFVTIGKCPISHATDPMRFSPIDLTAKAIVLLAGTNDKFTAFHADSRFGFDEWQLITAANRCGLTVTPVADEEYYSDYYRMLGDEKINSRLQGLVTNDRPDLHAVEVDNLFSANVLYRLGFSWPLPDSSYLERAIDSLMTLDYFELDEE